MKIEIGKDFPQYFKSLYPEEFELFSHLEVTAGIPHGKKMENRMSVSIHGVAFMGIKLLSLL